MSNANALCSADFTVRDGKEYFKVYAIMRTYVGYTVLLAFSLDNGNYAELHPDEVRLVKEG